MNVTKCYHYHMDCFAAIGMRCKLLTEQIDKPDCPFYKTNEEVTEGRIKAHRKLVDMGRQDLIEDYEYNKYRTW